MAVLVDLKRYAGDVQEILNRPVIQRAAVFYGSSTIRIWGQQRLEQDMAPMKALCHGFGGSTAEEALYYYPTLVRPYAPRALVWYEGDNDMCCGYAPDTAADLSCRVFQWAQTDFPGLPIIIIPVKHSPCRDLFLSQMNIYNQRLKDFAATRENVQILDLDGLLYDEDRALRTDIFQDDGLHFNQLGYEELAKLVRPALESVLDERWI
ncbi:MAG: GDSL-type esterase/lipase family protein [Eubacteriales bacterium]|nr:GDSL-type esterase/lipase family protein [Eubacteriales bacterium]